MGEPPARQPGKAAATMERAIPDTVILSGAASEAAESKDPPEGTEVAPAHVAPQREGAIHIPSGDSSTHSRTRSLRMTGIGCSVIPGVGAARGVALLRMTHTHITLSGAASEAANRRVPRGLETRSFCRPRSE